jgi:hypothetical protein
MRLGWDLRVDVFEPLKKPTSQIFSNHGKGADVAPWGRLFRRPQRTGGFPDSLTTVEFMAALETLFAVEPE